ncbi:AAA family ATPase [Sphingobium nicotianae]|uniref:AAA family ATPase n=1 Tax=Sphingobium nicotianae TaxID=2782607 RepID=A0A9X1DEC5_9SPHN|nr:AAA family ATPase [Sphingobium nicotianae]MBT2188361.1 AAA family ATPase [Sphingobium nicotianae]
MATASSAPASPDDQGDAVAFLGGGSAFEGKRPIRIDTHCASIFLVGDRAWKLKRAVKFGYLDFSTVQKRRAALEAELALNRRTAPQLYLGVQPLTRRADGQLAIGGSGETIDWLLEMHRFPDDALLSHLAERGRLDESMLAGLADRIHALHAMVEPVPSQDGAASFRRVVEGNLASMAAYPAVLDPRIVTHFEAALLEKTKEMAPLLDARARQGRVRHCHGDLHLANIARIEGVPTLFDCLEFSAELATIDVLYDLGFLLMDLWHRNLRMEANLVFNRYLDLSPPDEGGIALLPLFLSVRAAIRAHVLAAQSVRAGDDRVLAREARSFLDLAFNALKPVPARLVAIGGLSGTGKSSLARKLGGTIGRAPGARVLRSDVLRKRLAGLAPEETLPADSYSAQSAALVYRTLDTGCAETLAGGQSVIADAVFARRTERDRIEAVARQCDVDFTGLWLEADMSARIARVETRAADASDADRRVAEAQSALDIGELGSWHLIPASGSLDDVTAMAQVWLKHPRRWNGGHAMPYSGGD